MGGSVLVMPHLREEASEIMKIVFVKIFLGRIKIALGAESVSVPGKECLFRWRVSCRCCQSRAADWKCSGMRLAFWVKISTFCAMAEEVLEEDLSP